MSFSNIVVPVALQRYREPPPVACAQLSMARAQAQLSGAKLHVITGAAPLELVTDDLPVEAKLAEFTTSLLSEGFDISTEVLRGRPSEAILRYTERESCDLMILGTHSKNTPDEVPIGNTAAGLLAQYTGTVWLVRPTLEDIDRAKRLMIPEHPWVYAYQ
jgi:nucleotide-binding universal stress UspA family protein